MPRHAWAEAGASWPGEFIPVAEELRLIEAIGEWVVDEVARQQRAWREAGIRLEPSLNLSADIVKLDREVLARLVPLTGVTTVKIHQTGYPRRRR